MTRFFESLPLGVWSVSVERHPGARHQAITFKSGTLGATTTRPCVYRAALYRVDDLVRGRGGGRKEKIIGRTRRERDENRQTRESGLRETGSRCCWRGTSLPLTK